MQDPNKFAMLQIYNPETAKVEVVFKLVGQVHTI